MGLEFSLFLFTLKGFLIPEFIFSGDSCCKVEVFPLQKFSYSVGEDFESYASENEEELPAREI